MYITIRPTAVLTEIDGRAVRLWEGVTDRGTSCKVFVARVAVADNLAVPEIEATLRAMPAPAESFAPLWQVAPGTEGGD
jgi:hypothetical protein